MREEEKGYEEEEKGEEKEEEQDMDLLNKVQWQATKNILEGAKLQAAKDFLPLEKKNGRRIYRFQVPQHI